METKTKMNESLVFTDADALCSDSGAAKIRERLMDAARNGLEVESFVTGAALDDRQKRRLYEFLQYADSLTVRESDALTLFGDAEGHEPDDKTYEERIKARFGLRKCVFIDQEDDKRR